MGVPSDHIFGTPGLFCEANWRVETKTDWDVLVDHCRRIECFDRSLPFGMTVIGPNRKQCRITRVDEFCIWMTSIDGREIRLLWET